MRTKKVLYNSISSVLLQISVLLVGLVMPRVFMVGYGSEINGLVSSISQFISYLNLVEAGIAGAAIYALYKPLSNNEYDEINNIVSAAKRFYMKSGFIFLGLVIILAVTYPIFIKSTKLDYYSTFALVMILGFSGSMEFFTMAKYRVLLTADQKSYVLSIIAIISLIVNFLIMFTLASLRVDILIVRSVALLSYVLRSFLLYMYTTKKYKHIDYAKKSANIDLSRRWDVLVHQITGIIVFNSPVLIITFLCGLKSVSIYVVYNMIFSGLMLLMGVIQNSTQATFGNILAQDDGNVLKKIYSQFEYIYFTVMLCIYTCGAILIMPFVKIYTLGISDAIYIQPTLAVLFIVNALFNNIRIPSMTLIISAGHYKETKNAAIIEAVINVIASVVFAIGFGLSGVLFGQICSFAYRTIQIIIYSSRHIVHFSILNTFKRLLIGAVFSLIAMAPFYTIIKISPRNIFEFIFCSFGVLFWVVLVIVLGNYLSEKSTMLDVFIKIRKTFSCEEHAKM